MPGGDEPSRVARPRDLAHARAFRSVKRQQHLLGLLDTAPDPTELATALLESPMRQKAAFGILYTVLYRPQLGYVDYLWPDSSWHRRFDSPDHVRTVVLRAA